MNYLNSGQLTWRENARLAWSLANLEVMVPALRLTQDGSINRFLLSSFGILEVHDGSLLQTLQED